MNTTIADATSINYAATLLKQGRLVAFPTETVYGLGADASNPEAVQRIFTAKGRPSSHPLIVHIASPSQLADWASVIPDSAILLSQSFWPGPLALILKKQAWVPLEVTGGQNTVALRMPNHPVALNLLRTFNGGIAAPSANRFCRISPTQAEHVREELADRVDLILDGGACQIGLESTIVDLSGDHPRLLRPGQIGEQAIANALGITSLSNPLCSPEIRAPGMMALHYAPITRTILCSAVQLLTEIDRLITENKRIGILTYSLQYQSNPHVHVIKLTDSAEAYGQALYASLRKLDSLKLDQILVEQPPNNSSWWAVNDRLTKAAGFNHFD